MRAVVVGAGGIGQHIAHQLGVAGHEVMLVSRSGTGIGSGVGAAPSGNVVTARADAADAAAITSLAQGADVLVNAVNPPYTKWAELWPPMAQGFLTAAERTGAALLIVGNLYSYGKVTGPITESTPVTPNGTKGRVRDRMWQDALAAHRQGRVRVTEIRPSDYFGPGASKGVSYLNQYAILPAMNGRRALHIRGDMQVPHSWSYITDIAALAVAVLSADADGPDWGRAWHVPTAAPRTMTEVAHDVAELAGVQAHDPRPYPWLVRQGLRVIPLVRELDETAHQVEQPFVLDATDAENRFALTPTPWRDALTETMAWLRTRD